LPWVTLQLWLENCLSRNGYFKNNSKEKQSLDSRCMTSSKLLLALAIVTALAFAQPVKADRKAEAGPTYVNGRPVSVPDAGSTLSLLSFALLGVAVLQRKLRC
jgi:hypothetical protein